MKTRLLYEIGRISLAEDDESKPRADKNVLAAITLHEGTGCWQMVDVRLSQYRAPNPYAGGMMADDFAATYRPESEEEADFVKSLLREYREDADGTIVWCTFDGIVRGAATINGYAPPRFFDQAGYFSKKDGLAKLMEIQAFWSGYEGGTFRIDNPHLQPTETSIRMQVFQHKLQAADSHFDTALTPPH